MRRDSPFAVTAQCNGQPFKFAIGRWYRYHFISYVVCEPDKTVLVWAYPYPLPPGFNPRPFFSSLLFFFFAPAPRPSDPAPAHFFFQKPPSPALSSPSRWWGFGRSGEASVFGDATRAASFCFQLYIYTPAQRSWRGGILDSPCPSVCPSVCRRHGFRSISQVCFGISISNFICMLMVAIGRSLLIFSDVTFKMAAWRPYWIFWFPDSNFTSALNINFKLQRHNTYVYG